jgi:hypothetical protein
MSFFVFSDIIKIEFNDLESLFLMNGVFDDVQIQLSVTDNYSWPDVHGNR